MNLSIRIQIILKNFGRVDWEVKMIWLVLFSLVPKMMAKASLSCFIPSVWWGGATSLSSESVQSALSRLFAGWKVAAYFWLGIHGIWHLGIKAPKSDRGSSKQKHLQGMITFTRYRNYGFQRMKCAKFILAYAIREWDRDQSFCSVIFIFLRLSSLLWIKLFSSTRYHGSIYSNASCITIQGPKEGH